MKPSCITVRSSRPAVRCVEIIDLLFRIETSDPVEFIDLTNLINDHLRRNNVQDGSVTVFSRHTTAAIKINEAEELLIEDFKQFLSTLCPRSGSYNHNDMKRRKPPIRVDERPNAHSHLMHLLLSTSETIPVSNFRLALGRWQSVCFIELDGPRSRDVVVRCASYRPRRSAAVINSRRKPVRSRRTDQPIEGCEIVVDEDHEPKPTPIRRLRRDEL